ncbi:MAG: pilus assembly protein TadG-related protein [Acidimicrobiia bacterium]
MTPKRTHPRHARRIDERGSFTIWALGLAVTLLFFGGIAIDCWRMFGARRDLVQATEAAARAGASGIDENRLRNDGILTLDPSVVNARAQAAIADRSNNAQLDGPASVRINGFAVTVRAQSTVTLPLIGILSPGSAERTMYASATARPQVG